MNELTDEEVYKKLSAPIKTERRKGGFNKDTQEFEDYEYIKIENIIERLNSTWGINWSFEILKEYIGNEDVYAMVRLHYPLSDGTMRFKDSVGGTSKSTAPGLANQMKKSVSLGLVKAASLLGIDIKDTESNGEQHEEISALVEQLGGQRPSKERLKALNFQEADKMIEALKEKLKK
jgi:hypothetical protein